MIGNLGRRKAYWTLPPMFDSTLSFTSLQPNAQHQPRALARRLNADVRRRCLDSPPPRRGLASCRGQTSVTLLSMGILNQRFSASASS